MYFFLRREKPSVYYHMLQRSSCLVSSVCLMGTRRKRRSKACLAYTGWVWKAFLLWILPGKYILHLQFFLTSRIGINVDSPLHAGLKGRKSFKIVLLENWGGNCHLYSYCHSFMSWRGWGIRYYTTGKLATPAVVQVDYASGNAKDRGPHE